MSLIFAHVPLLNFFKNVTSKIMVGCLLPCLSSETSDDLLHLTLTFLTDDKGLELLS